MSALHDAPERVWQERCPVGMREFNGVRVGYFRVRKVAGGPWCAGRIWAYRPRVAGTDHLAAHVNGEFVDPVWLWQSGREIDEASYKELMNSPSPTPEQPVSRRKNLGETS
jgi:hypothetical protein